MELILASTSPYRRKLLERLQIPFRCEPPGVDESVGPDLPPDELAGRLAQAKCRAVAERFPDALVIGSDQVAALGDLILGKPGSHERARQQLLACSGQRLDFFTGVALEHLHSGHHESRVERFSVDFRTLTGPEIEDYLHRDQPFDCAGSFKWEGLGISLFRRLVGADPTALEGLPLIALTDMLSAAGLQVLKTE